MAGRNLSSAAFAFARFIQRESRRLSCTPRDRAARRRHGLGVRSGPCRRFFAGNHRQNRRRGYACHGNHPVHQAGPSATTTATNGEIPAMHQAGPSAPAVTNEYVGHATIPTVFSIPLMEWLLAGPSAPFLGEEEMFPCELAPPPLPPYCLQHEFGPCPARTGAQPRLPSPTPSDELPEHFFPPGYGPVPDLPSPTPAAVEVHAYSTVPDLNMAIKKKKRR